MKDKEKKPPDKNDFLKEDSVSLKVIFDPPSPGAYVDAESDNSFKNPKRSRKTIKHRCRSNQSRDSSESVHSQECYSEKVTMVSEVADFPASEYSIQLGQVSPKSTLEASDQFNKVPDSLPPTLSSSQSPQSSFPNLNTRKNYLNSDKGPFIVHVIKVGDLPTTLHPITFGRIMKSIQVANIINGSIEKVGRNRISVSFKSATNANEFINNNLLLTKDLKAFIPSFNICKMGIIRGIPTDLSHEEIIDLVSVPENCGKVIKARRLNYKVSVDGTTQWKPSQTVVLTFDGQVLPERVFICYNSIPVVLYSFPTIQCFSCCRFGHTQIKCRSNPRCFKCGGSHLGKSCPCQEDDAHCINCSGHHFATNNVCPEFSRQKNIKNIMAEKSISYSEASKLCSSSKKSFAEVASTPSTISYKKTIFRNPRPPPPPSHGYDRVAHAAIINDDGSHFSSNGTAFNLPKISSPLPQDQIIINLISSLLSFLSSSTLNLPSNVASILPVLSSVVNNNANCTSTKNP